MAIFVVTRTIVKTVKIEATDLADAQVIVRDSQILWEMDSMTENIYESKKTPRQECVNVDDDCPF